MLCPHAEFWGPAYQQRFNVLTYGHIADTRGRHAHTHRYRPGIDPAVFLTVYPELLGGSCSHWFYSYIFQCPSLQEGTAEAGGEGRHRAFELLAN